MKKTTIFTWGYYGWGNAKPQLVEAVDTVETNRGFEPPIFVDIRIRRTVRAKGFMGNAFEKQLGPGRHRWMKSLGNQFIKTRTGPAIQIAEPSATDELLDLAQEAAGHNQRVLFFCSCQWPKREGEIACRRCTVADLVLRLARRHGESIEIVEWPGGEPGHSNVDVTPEVFTAVKRGRMSVPLEGTPELAKIAGLPWGTIAMLHSGHEQLHRIVGPAIWQTDKWSLPVFPTDAEGLPEYERAAAKLRTSLGLDPASV